MKLLLVVALNFIGCQGQQPWDKYNLSPTTRTVVPIKIWLQAGGVSNDNGSIFPVKLKGVGSFIVFDFGKEVGGITTLSFGAVSDGRQSAGLAYSESTNYAACPSDAVSACDAGLQGQAGAGDHSNGGNGPDGTLTTGPLTANSEHTPTPEHMRGGFRYLNVFLETSGTVEITNITLAFTPAPLIGNNPSAYANHFCSSDDLLNRIWYAAAYTAQMCTIPPSQGRAWGPPASGWNNAVLIGTGDSILVDGAKRDRTIWPGDMGVSSATSFATTGDTLSSVNSLNTLYALQNPSTGMLPYVGPEVFCQKPWGSNCLGSGAWASDTYHLWALIGTGNVFHYTTNSTWLASVWDGYKAGVRCSVTKIGRNGLMVVDASADWQRGGQGGENVAANALLCRVLADAVGLAAAINDTAAVQEFGTAEVKLKAAINSPLLWDETKGAYHDNPTNKKLFPQDGNSIILWFNISASATRNSRVSDYLMSNWNARGFSVSPEWIYQGVAAVGTFPGSIEVLAHMAAGREDRGMQLIRSQWGYMLEAANSTQSTFWEGFQADGQYAFESIYMSHAHGWATGPAPALSFYVLGLRPLTPTAGGEDYVVAPQPGSLRFCRGSLTLGQHTVVVAWEVSSNSFKLQVNSTRMGGTGRIGLPLPNVSQQLGMELRVDEDVAYEQSKWTYASSNLVFEGMDGGRLWLVMTAGSHVLSLSY